MAAIIKLPIPCLERIFKYLSWKDLVHCSAVCIEWNSILSDGNILCWDIASARFLPAESRVFDLIRGLSHKEKIIAFACAWTKNTISGNMYILGNHFTIHRRPIANSSDAARASVGFTCGIHRWVVRFESPRLGSHSGVGICTSSASLHGKDYYFVIGEDGESWGWDVVKHDLRHDGKTVGTITNEVVSGDKIGIILDADRGTVSFELNDVLIGMPFENLPLKTKLFPCISTVYGDSEVSMIYVGGPVVG